MRMPRPSTNSLLTSPHPLGTKTSFSALRIEENGQTFYLLTAPKEDIFPFCYVVDREEDPRKGFQRELDTRRALEIASYLEQPARSIPLNVVLSAQPNAELNYDPKTKKLQFRRESKAFLVLDGQHRL